MRNLFCSLVCLLASWHVPLPILAQVSQRLLPVQGRLVRPDGVTLGDGVRLVQFRIFDVPSGGSPVWAGELHRTTVNGGLVNLMLGTKAPFPTDGQDGRPFFDRPLYLEITVDVSGPDGVPDNIIDSSDPPMLPRQVLLPVVFATQAAVARTADHATVSDRATRSATADDSGPVGQIISLWPLAPEPDTNYWRRCDGVSAVPPDSRLGQHLKSIGQPLITPKLDDDRFLLGSTSLRSGGDNQLTISEPQMPVHTHDVGVAGNHYHVLVARLSFGNTTWPTRLSRGGPNFDDEEVIDNVRTSTEGDHTHALSPAGGGKPFSILDSTTGSTTGVRYQTVRYYIRIN